MVKNKSLTQKVLGNSKKRYLKIPNDQFYEISHGDVAEILYIETDNELQLIYRFKNEDLKKYEQIKAEMKRTKLIKIKQKRLKQIKIDEETDKLKKAHKFKKAFEVEKELKGQVPCEFCDKPLTKRVVTFVNVAQNPVHYFCSRKCKFLWIYKKQQNDN